MIQQQLSDGDWWQWFAWDQVFTRGNEDRCVPRGGGGKAVGAAYELTAGRNYVHPIAESELLPQQFRRDLEPREFETRIDKQLRC